MSARKAYDLVTSAYPFRDLTEDDFRDVVRELSGNRILWLDEDLDRLEKSGGTWQYFYANLSMIPDEETYTVSDVASGRAIGSLDERFVVNFAGPGETFIQRGEMWRIAEVDDEESEVKVSPIEDPTGEVPSWTGSEIPVPKPVASEVGEIRGWIGEAFSGGASRSAVAADLAERYPTDEYTASEALGPLEKQVETGSPMPTDERIVVEYEPRSIVVNACFGHTVNQTLGRVLSALLGQQTGSSVGLEIDPTESNSTCRAGSRVAMSRVCSGRRNRRTSRGSSNSASRTPTPSSSNSPRSRRRSGRSSPGAAMERSVETASSRRSKILPSTTRPSARSSTRTSRLSRRARCSRRSGKETIEVVLHTEHTPVGIDGRSSGRELLAPENADASVIDTVRERIQEDRMLLFCLHCQEWERTQEVKRIPDQPECPFCGSTRIAALNPWAEEVVAAVKTAEKDDEQEKQTQRAYQAATLVQSHGKQAVIALAARGVGPHNAARIIAKLRENEDDFYRDILSQERQYARTQSFWD